MRRLFAPIGNEPPLQEVERALARVPVLTDDPKLLARCCIVAQRNVRHAAIGHVDTGEDGEWDNGFSLDSTAAHGPYLGGLRRLFQTRRWCWRPPPSSSPIGRSPVLGLSCLNATGSRGTGVTLTLMEED
jgi:hypothetical protein